MGVKTVTSHLRYLGLPVIFGRSKKEIFTLVIEWVGGKIKGWKEKFLSRAGKEVLIKAVAQAIPSYVMSCYKLPESCFQEIEGMIAKFWWGSKEGSRKIQWLSWENLTRAKGEGGMGFRGISEFNISFLGKHYWRLMTDENSLMAKVFKGRYFPNRSLSDATIGYKPSYAWRSILGAKDVVSKGLRWRIGNGKKVRICSDNWLPYNTGFKSLNSGPNRDLDAKVSELIDQDLVLWNVEKVWNLFCLMKAKQILSIPLSLRQPEDKQIWHYEISGHYEKIMCSLASHHMIQQIEQ